MRSLRNKSILLSIIFFATGYSKNTKLDINYEKNRGNNSLRDGRFDESGKLSACYIKPQWHVCKYHIIKWQREFRWRAYYDPDEDECYYFRGCPETNKDLFTFDVDCRKACVSVKDKHEVKLAMIQTNNSQIKYKSDTKKNGQTMASRKPRQCYKKPKLFKSNRCPVGKALKRAMYSLETGRCKYFTDCEDRNKNFWDDIDDCQEACVTNYDDWLSKKKLKNSLKKKRHTNKINKNTIKRTHTTHK